MVLLWGRAYIDKQNKTHLAFRVGLANNDPAHQSWDARCSLPGNLAQSLFGCHFCCFIFAISFICIKLTLTHIWARKERCLPVAEVQELPRNSPRNIASKWGSGFHIFRKHAYIGIIYRDIQHTSLILELCYWLRMSWKF